LNIETRLRALEERMPKGYTTFNANGVPVIQSDLSALEWMVWAFELLRSPGREAQKRALRALLEASTDVDGDKGYLYLAVAAMAHGPVTAPDFSPREPETLIAPSVYAAEA
jgi:hypothetical protein